MVQASRITGQLALSSVSVTNTSLQPLHVETVVISCFSVVYVRIVLWLRVRKCKEHSSRWTLFPALHISWVSLSKVAQIPAAIERGVWGILDIHKVDWATVVLVFWQYFLEFCTFTCIWKPLVVDFANSSFRKRWCHLGPILRTLRQRGVDEVATEALKKLEESKAQSPHWYQPSGLLGYLRMGMSNTFNNIKFGYIRLYGWIMDLFVYPLRYYFEPFWTCPCS